MELNKKALREAQHALLDREADGAIWLRDRGSKTARAVVEAYVQSCREQLSGFDAEREANG